MFLKINYLTHYNVLSKTIPIAYLISLYYIRFLRIMMLQEEKFL